MIHSIDDLWIGEGGGEREGVSRGEKKRKREKERKRERRGDINQFQIPSTNHRNLCALHIPRNKDKESVFCFIYFIYFYFILFMLCVDPDVC